MISISSAYITNSSSMVVTMKILDVEWIKENFPSFEELKECLENHKMLTKYFGFSKEYQSRIRQSYRKAYEDLKKIINKQDSTFEFTFDAPMDGEGLYLEFSYRYALAIVIDCIMNYWIKNSNPYGKILVSSERVKFGEVLKN